MSKPLVIVESPAKARTIRRFLGPGYEVEASIGHVRDLPQSASDIPSKYKGEKWARIAVDTENDFKPLYVLTQRGKEQVKMLKAKLKDADQLLLATDEDREGEAIAWHLVEVLKPKVPVKRLVFHEITQQAITDSLDHARELDMNLVRAQETRRIIDRLFGYNISPVLWRKIKPKLSAGRVQSVAVRLLVHRERERMRFVEATWWDLTGQFKAESGSYEGRLIEVDGTSIATGKDFDPETGKLKKPGERMLIDEKHAAQLQGELAGSVGAISRVQKKNFTEKPAKPFTTSSLQQEANRKLRWTARRTMSVAQRLYENGWITYMRTDSTHLSPEALAAARKAIAQKFGPKLMPAQPRTYKAGTKGAQEAHEAIRPAGSQFKTLKEANRELDADEARLYTLVWNRTMACQMIDASGVRMTVNTEFKTASHNSIIFRTSGKTYSEPGFRRLYISGTEEDGDTVPERGLPPMRENEVSQVTSVEAEGHTTQPSTRFNEASLVQRLEELGIGRPSTYASIIDTIQLRKYAFKKSNALVPTLTAFAVTRLLEDHFSKLVDYDFTANLETGLDDIASGGLNPLGFLEDFYRGPSSSEGLLTLIEAAQNAADPREICAIPLGEYKGHPVVARVGRFGPYLEHDGSTRSLPEDVPPDELNIAHAIEVLSTQAEGPRALGTDPDSDLPVTVHDGRFGPYVQLGEQEQGKKAKPKRSSLLPPMTFDTMDLATALRLLSLPRTIGKDAEGEDIVAQNGRYGPYIKAGKDTRSIPPEISVLDINEAQALELLAQPARRGKSATVLHELGKDAEGRDVVIRSGRFGPYCTDGEVNATIKRGTDPDQVSLQDALVMLEHKRANPRPKKKQKRSTKRTKKK